MLHLTPGPFPMGRGDKTFAHPTILNPLPSGEGPGVRRLVLVPLFLALVLSLAACFPQFDPVTQIEHLRVLGIKAEPPEAAPGDAVTLTALVANADGTPYEGVYLWAVLGITGTEFAQMGSSHFDPNRLPPGGFGIQTPGGAPFAYSVPQPDDPGSILGIPFRDSGILLTALLVVVEGSPDATEILADLAAGGTKFEYRFAYKTVIVSTRTADQRNSNPVLNHVEVKRFGQVIEPDPGDGSYHVGYGDVAHIAAIFDNAEGSRVTFSWFDSIKEGFGDGQGNKARDWKLPSHVGAYTIYVVCRNNYEFHSDQGYSARSSGMDWGTATLVVEKTP